MIHRNRFIRVKKTGGFSLVELSIVLVILGLLVGGVLTGRDLIRAAELRSISTEYNDWMTAVNLFKEKYMALPGDMKNATSFWGTSANCPGTSAQGTTDGTTCNGDGNGQIENSAPTSNEWFRAWQHLANATLITGTYNGVQGPVQSIHAVIGTNVPKSRFPGGGWTLRWLGNYAGNSSRYAMDYGQMLHFGGQYADNETFAMILTPEELWSIDTKMDDGKPGQGFVIARWWDSCTDAATFSVLDSNYLLNQSGKLCSIIFRNIL